LRFSARLGTVQSNFYKQYARFISSNNPYSTWDAAWCQAADLRF
jgi:hypothetical protein